MNEKSIEEIEKVTQSSDEDIPFVKSEAEKKFVRKLNIRLLPLSMLIVFLQFVDKAALSISAVLGILEDTNTSYANYSILGALFYLGFFLFQVPNSYFLQKYPVGKYMGVLLICWGTVTIATAFCTNFIQLSALRVLLGLFEGGTYPGLILVFNTMYRRSEQSACFGFLYLSNGLANAVGSSASVGIASMDTVFGIKAWQWGYIIWGIITVVSGFVVFFILIDSPQSWFLQLTEEEKEIVESRTRDNAVVRKQKIIFGQYLEALKEVRCWLIFFVSTAHNLQIGGLITFGTVFVKGLGFSTIESIAFQVPCGALSVISSLIAIYIHRRSNQMIYTACLPYSVAIIGCLLLAVLPHNGIKLLGYYLAWLQPGAYGMLITIIGSTVSGYSKKIFYNAVLMLGYTVGNFGGPLMLVDTTAPKYLPAMWSLFALNIFNIVCLFVIRIVLARINKKRAPYRELEPTDVYLNLTDKQDKNYVYSL